MAWQPSQAADTKIFGIRHDNFGVLVNWNIAMEYRLNYTVL